MRAALPLAIAFIAIGCTSSFGADAPSIAPDAGQMPPPIDGGALAADAGDATPPADGGPAGRFCQPSMFLCADFDGENIGEWSVASNFKDETNIVGGSFEVGSTFGKDSAGVRTFMPKGAQGILARRFVHDGVADVVVEADVLVERPINDKPLSTQSLVVLRAAFGQGALQMYVEARVTGVDGGANLLLHAQAQDYQATSGGTISELIPYGVWTRLKLEAGLLSAAGGEAAVARVSFRDGAVERKATIKRAQVGNAAPLKTYTVVGVEADSPTPIDMVVRFDNVSVDQR